MSFCKKKKINWRVTLASEFIPSEKPIGATV